MKGGLTFKLEQRGDTQCVIWVDGFGVRPASEEESELWAALDTLQAQHDAFYLAVEGEEKRLRDSASLRDWAVADHLQEILAAAGEKREVPDYGAAKKALLWFKGYGEEMGDEAILLVAREGLGEVQADAREREREKLERALRQQHREAHGADCDCRAFEVEQLAATGQKGAE